MFYHLGIFVRLYVRRRIFRKISRKVNPLRTSCRPFPYFSLLWRVWSVIVWRGWEILILKGRNLPFHGKPLALGCRENPSSCGLNSWRVYHGLICLRKFSVWKEVIQSYLGRPSSLFGHSPRAARGPTGLVGRNCEFPALFKEIEEVVKGVENFRLSGDVGGKPFWVFIFDLLIRSCIPSGHQTWHAGKSSSHCSMFFSQQNTSIELGDFQLRSLIVGTCYPKLSRYIPKLQMIFNDFPLFNSHIW